MNIRGLVFKIVLKIIFLTSFIIITGIYWNHLEINNYTAYVDGVANSNYVDFDIDSNHGYVLNLLDDYSLNDSKFDLNIYNDTNTEENYEIALAVNKDCDYKKLYISIDDNIYNLSNLFLYDDYQYNYFKVVDSSIKNDNVNYSLGLYIDDCDVDYFNNNGVELSFLNLKSNNV